MTKAIAANEFGEPDKSVMDHAEEAVAQAAPWIIVMGRFGLVVKGIVYALVGFLALQGATGSRHIRADKAGAFRELLTRPFGRTLLIVIAVGLFAYALYRIVHSIFDFDRDGNEPKSLARRAGRLGSGIVYAGLGGIAVKTMLGFGSRADSVQDWTSWGMSKPLGRWLVAIAGLIVLGRGVFQLYKAWKTDLGRSFKYFEMGPLAHRCAILFGRAGLTARGLLFLLIGLFLLLAAWNHDPHQAHGLGGSLSALERAPYGPFLLAAVAFGFFAYALFAFAEARYSEISCPPRPTP